MRRPRTLRPAALAARAAPLFALFAAAAPAARAQSQARDGFLFRRPVATLTLRGGYDRALAGSDVFGDLTSRLTLGRGDFSAPAVGGDLAFSLADRLDLVFSTTFARSRRDSEYRKFVGTDDLPIAQQTTFTRLPVLASARFYLAPRGERVGSFAWVPTRVAPFVGVGGGGTWYRLRQSGEFLNESTLRVFRADDVQSSGWALTGVGSAGVDLSLSPRFLVTTEARYQRGRARLGESFVGYDPADLSGVSLTAGVAVRF